MPQPNTSLPVTLPLRSLAFAVMAAVLAVTLSPSQEWADAKTPFCILCESISLSDLLGNIALYLPIGAALALNGFGIRSALGLGLMITGVVETAQFWIPGRDPSLIDVLCNAAGAVIGCWALRTRIGRSYIGVVERAVETLVRPRVTLANAFSLGAASFAIFVFLATGALLDIVVPEGPYAVGASALKTTSLPLRIGGNTESRDFFPGMLDEIRIYNRFKVGADIQADVNAPVELDGAIQSEHAGLVAAYGFNDQARGALVDYSGQGNNGRVTGAGWVNEGRFAGALRFDGHDDVVVIPSADGMNLTAGMTIEAWVYPTNVPEGWANVVQKDVDAYFLTASSDGGPLRPAAGGTFGGRLLNVRATAPIPLNRWTHLATTYDGSTLRLYTNGNEVARRALWAPSRRVVLSVGDLAMQPGSVANSDQVRDRLARGDVIRLSALLGPATGSDAPIAGLYDRHHEEVLSIGRSGNDLTFRPTTRAASLGLNVPELRLREALPTATTEDALSVTVARRGRGYCVAVNGRTMCGIGYTLGDGWAVLIHSQPLPRWIDIALTTSWLAILVFPVGFWALRTRVGSVSILAVLAGVVLLPRPLGVQATPVLQVAAAFAGLILGRACHWMLTVGYRRARLIERPREIEVTHPSPFRERPA